MSQYVHSTFITNFKSQIITNSNLNSQLILIFYQPITTCHIQGDPT